MWVSKAHILDEMKEKKSINYLFLYRFRVPLFLPFSDMESIKSLVYCICYRNCFLSLRHTVSVDVDFLWLYADRTITGEPQCLADICHLVHRGGAVTAEEQQKSNNMKKAKCCQLSHRLLNLFCSWSFN